MTEVQPTYQPAGEGEDIYDPSAFVVTSALNGRKGVIQLGSTFKRHAYVTKEGQQIGDESTVLVITIVSPDLDKPKANLIAAGETYPSPDGKTKAALVDGKIAGPHLVGKIGKNTNLADFLSNLKASGFPTEKLRAAGASALDGAAFIWRALEKTVGFGKDKKVKAYDVPAQFLGFEEVTGAPAAVASVQASQVAGSQVSEELKKELAGYLTAALKEAPGNEIPRGQLAIKVGPAIKDHPKKMELYALLLKDEFLGSIEGAAFDKKSLKLQA